MKWCTYVSPADGSSRVGLLDDKGENILGLSAGVTLLQLLEESSLGEAGRRVTSNPVEIVPLSEARLLAPITRPPSVRDFMSFEDHLVYSASAMGVPVPAIWYQRPMFYFTNPAALLGPRDPVSVPGSTTALDYELEVAVVVGRAGSNLSPADAEDCIAGYVVFCDWSARDVQRAEMPMMIGPSKSKDFATSLSGFLVTPDELEGSRDSSRHSLAMTATVNGVAHSAGSLADLHWSFPEMLSAASENTTLHPGDVVASGTVGAGCILELAGRHGADRYPFLKAGDRVVLEVESIGIVDVLIEA